jgi:hypothetical protein
MMKRKNETQKALIADWRNWRARKERSLLDQIRARAIGCGMGGKFSIGRITNKQNLIKLIF